MTKEYYKQVKKFEDLFFRNTDEELIYNIIRQLINSVQKKEMMDDYNKIIKVRISQSKKAKLRSNNETTKV